MYNHENNQGFGPYDNGNNAGEPYVGSDKTGHPKTPPPWPDGSWQAGPFPEKQYGQPQYYEPQDTGPYFNGVNSAENGPFGFPSQYQGGGHPGMPYEQPDHSRKNSGLAIACFVLGILGFLGGIFFIGIAFDVLAFILGIVALTQNSRKKGLPVAGMVLAVLSVLLTFLFYYAVSMDEDASVRGIKNADSYLPTAEEKAAAGALMKNIVQEDYVSPRNLILIYENNNEQDVQLEITVTYYDENDDLLFLRNSYIWSCPAGGRAAADVPLPYNRNYEDIPYSRYEVDTIARKSDPQYYTPNAGKDFQIKSNPGLQGGVIASILNPTGKTFDSVELMCVYFKDGTAAGSSYGYLSDMGKSATVEFSPPYDANYNELSYDDYEIFVNSTDIYGD